MAVSYVHKHGFSCSSRASVLRHHRSSKARSKLPKRDLQFPFLFVLSLPFLGCPPDRRQCLPTCNIREFRMLLAASDSWVWGLCRVRAGQRSNAHTTISSCSTGNDVVRQRRGQRRNVRRCQQRGQEKGLGLLRGVIEGRAVLDVRH